MIVISTHAVFLENRDIYGPPHATSLFLNKKKVDHIFIKHRLYGGGKSKIEYYRAGRLFKIEEKKIPNGVLQYIWEIALTMQTVLKNGYCSIFIGVDPLNAFAGNLLKLLKKVGKTVYFSADFALHRFDNAIVNSFYHFLDRKAMFGSNQTWSVSKRIVGYRTQKGLSTYRNFIMPNAPFFHDIKRLEYNKIKPHDLVIVSALEKGIAFELLLDVINNLRKQIEDVKLVIIGAGSREASLKKHVKKKLLYKHVKFCGPLSHDDMFQVLVKCAVGIAFYENSDQNHFRYFSDPMKVRDYLAAGLPVFISGNSAIGEELQKRKAGYTVTLEIKDIYEKILKLLKNPTKYKQMRENSIQLAKEYDTFALLSRYFSNLGFKT